MTARRARLYGPDFWGRVCQQEPPHAFARTVEPFREAVVREWAITEAIQADPFTHLPSGIAIPSLSAILAKAQRALDRHDWRTWTTRPATRKASGHRKAPVVPMPYPARCAETVCLTQADYAAALAGDMFAGREPYGWSEPGRNALLIHLAPALMGSGISPEALHDAVADMARTRAA